MISLLLALAAPASAQMPAFLTGCWAMSNTDGWTQECWMEPRAGIMIGASRQGRGDTLKIWEWMNVQQSTDGTMTFRASPNGNPGASFKADQVTATSIRFTNPANDYPQRITYKLTNGKLEAEVSKLDGSDAMRWSYHREGGPSAP